MKRIIPIFVLTGLYLVLLSGCMRAALRMSPTLFPNFAAAIFEECDPALAKDAIPANLKLLEGLLKNDPENKRILTTLSMGFSGYSMLFLEEEEPERASEFYLRAMKYSLRSLGSKGRTLENAGSKTADIQKTLQGIGKKDYDAFFWTAVALNAWINLNLDKPAALAQLGLSQAYLKRVLEIDGNYLHGFPYILMGVTLAARPRMFGGNIQQAKFNFEKALSLSDGKFLLVHYYYARYYAPRAQDKDLFLELIDEMINGNPRDLPDVCLINTMIQDRAIELKAMADELFF